MSCGRENASITRRPEPKGAFKFSLVIYHPACHRLWFSGIASVFGLLFPPSPLSLPLPSSLFGGSHLESQLELRRRILSQRSSVVFISYISCSGFSFILFIYLCESWLFRLSRKVVLYFHQTFYYLHPFSCYLFISYNFLYSTARRVIRGTTTLIEKYCRNLSWLRHVMWYPRGQTANRRNERAMKKILLRRD